MERMRTIVLLLALGVASTGVVRPGLAANVPQEQVSDASVAVACAPCPCSCSPLAGAWVAKLSSPVSTVVQTFKFAPVNAPCTKFVVNSQASTRVEKVIKCWPEANYLTEFVGTACKVESCRADFTAIGYGVQKTDCVDRVVFIAVMSGAVTLPVTCSAPTCACDGDCDGPYGCKCGSKDPRELDVLVTVAYFDACQDEDRDGLPDTCDSVICACYTTELKRVELQPPCEPTESFVAQLKVYKDCETEATGRAICKLSKDCKDMHYLLTVKDIWDVKAARIHVCPPTDAVEPVAVALCPGATFKPGKCTGLLYQGKFCASDFVGPLQGKKMEDLVCAIKEGRASLRICTKKYPDGEIHGKIEDP